MTRELSPLEKDMQESEASISDIGRCFNDTNLYIYSVRKWKNGEIGAIVDFYEIVEDVDSEGNSLYVKEKYRYLGHRDNLYFVNSETNLLQDHDYYELWRRCPLVAEGIIARYVKTSIIDRSYPEMFETYYTMEMTFYALDRKRIDPYSFDINLEEEFANGIHLREEQKKIEFSLQHLLPFLKESQHAQIEIMADAYIKFVKSKATISIDSQTNENDGRKRKPSKKSKKNYSNYSFLLNIDSRKLDALYLMLSKRDDTGKSFIDGDLQKYNDTKCLQLDNEYIKQLNPVDINKMLFKQVFLGKETDVQIVWRGDAVELWYLIYSLSNYRVKGKMILEKSGSG